MELRTIFDRFVTSKQAAGITHATIKWYSAQCRRFFAWYEDQDEQELTPELMEAYFVYLRTTKKLLANWPGDRLSDRSIHSAFRALRAFFKWSVGRGLLPKSPMTEIKVKRPEPNIPKQVTREEVDRLIDTIATEKWKDRRDRLAIATLFYCGLRVGELVQLEEQHFDLENCLLHVPGGKTGAGVVPLLPIVIELFKEYMAIRPQGCSKRLLLSVTARSDRPKWLSAHGVRLMIYRRCDNVSMRQLNPHSFRHGIAMHLLNERNADLYLIQNILRHSRPNVTAEYYIRWQTKALKQRFYEHMLD